MTPEEYEAKVKSDFTYATSSQRWDDHLAVYPNVDGSTRDNVSWLRERAVEEERKLAEINRQLGVSS